MKKFEKNHQRERERDICEVVRNYKVRLMLNVPGYASQSSKETTDNRWLLFSIFT